MQLDDNFLDFLFDSKVIYTTCRHRLTSSMEIFRVRSQHVLEKNNFILKSLSEYFTGIGYCHFMVYALNQVERRI